MVEVRTGDVEVLVWLGVVVLARGVTALGVLALGVVAPGRVALGAVACGAVIVVVTFVAVLPPQPATKHRATSSANPQAKFLTAEHSSRPPGSSRVAYVNAAACGAVLGCRSERSTPCSCPPATLARIGWRLCR